MFEFKVTSEEIDQLSLTRSFLLCIDVKAPIESYIASNRLTLLLFESQDVCAFCKRVDIRGAGSFVVQHGGMRTCWGIQMYHVCQVLNLLYQLQIG